MKTRVVNKCVLDYILHKRVWLCAFLFSKKKKEMWMWSEKFSYQNNNNNNNNIGYLNLSTIRVCCSVVILSLNVFPFPKFVRYLTTKGCTNLRDWNYCKIIGIDLHWIMSLHALIIRCWRNFNFQKLAAYVTEFGREGEEALLVTVQMG